MVHTATCFLSKIYSTYYYNYKFFLGSLLRSPWLHLQLYKSRGPSNTLILEGNYKWDMCCIIIQQHISVETLYLRILSLYKTTLIADLYIKIEWFQLITNRIKNCTIRCCHRRLQLENFATTWNAINYSTMTTLWKSNISTYVLDLFIARKCSNYLILHITSMSN